MKILNHLVALGVCSALLGCDAMGGAPAGVPGGVEFQFTAEIDKEGNCQPERIGIADVGSTRLFAVRGEATYSMPDGDTHIPFQGVYKWPDEKGFADDTAIIMLNYPGTCADLAVKIRIDYCEYDTGQGREKRACPELKVSGAEAFSSIELLRKDLEDGES